jgi:hypothetical protein
VTALADSYKLEIEFPTSALFGNAFVLDSSALNGIQKLGGNVYEDVTADVVEITINRGRSRQLDSFDSGTMTFSLRNNTRKYDPTNQSSIYYGGIEPRRPVRLSANSTYLYYGWIDDWSIDFSIPTESRVIASCVDAFSIFASIELDEFVFTAGERSDQRITTALALPEVGNTGIATSFEQGDSTMADDTVALGTSLLDYIQRVNKSEQGYLFVKGDGTLRFRSRGTEYSGTIPIFQDTVSTSSTEFKYMDVKIQFGTELLYNRVSVLNDGEETPVIVDDTTSQDSYLVRTLTISDLILEDDTQATDIANFLLGKYSRPEFRFESVTVSLEDMTTAQQNALFALEPNDLVAVKRTYTTGSPLTILRYGVIEGVIHNISLIAHSVTFNLSPATGSLRLDNALFGVLDSNTLGA